MGQKVYVVDGNLYNPDDDNEYKTYCAALDEELEAESYWTHTVSKLVKGKNVKQLSFKNLDQAYDYIKTNYPEKYDENNAAQNMKESHENEIEGLSPRIVIDARKNLEEMLDFCVKLFYEFDSDTTEYSIANNTYSGKSVFNYRSLPCVLLYIRNYGFGYIAQYTEVYKKIRDDLNIPASSCIINGRTNAIEQEYLKSSVFVCSSRFEGFGMVIVEAMACGLAVVSFDCPWGPGSIIADGEDGILVENGRVDLLAEAPDDVISSPEKQTSMAVKAAKSVQRFRMDQIAQRWKTLFQQLTEGEIERR